MGWNLLKPRSTGWRDVSLWVPDRVSGRLVVERTEHQMVVILDELALDRDGQVSFARFPSGLRPQFRARGDWFPSTATGPGGSINISGGGYFNVYDVVAGQAMTGRVVGDFLPGRPFPSPVPGDAI